jgi:hypothetical protein
MSEGLDTSISLPRKWSLSTKLFMVSVIVLLAIPMSCGRDAFRLSDYSEFRADVGNDVTLLIEVVGTYRDVDSAGTRWTTSGAPYSFLARLDGPAAVLEKYRGVELELTGGDGTKIDMHNRAGFTRPYPDAAFLSLVAGTFVLPYQDYQMNGSLLVVADGVTRRIPFSGRLAAVYREETRWAFFEIVMGV